jgi:AcrR family transcriptional regulator
MTETRPSGGNRDDGPRPRRWGTSSALLDDDEARRRLVAAAIRCIVRRGSGRVSMDEVADEAGVSRATVYRYYRTREDLLLGVILSRLDEAMTHVVRSLEEPGNAARSIPELILVSTGLTEGGTVSEALFSPDSRPLVTSVEASALPILEGAFRHVAPLLEQWQADGQLAADLDIWTTARWLYLISVMLTSPPWPDMPLADKRAFLDRYVVRALLADPSGNAIPQ